MSWRDGAHGVDRGGCLASLAGAMLSSKPPPYTSELVVEARESAGKIEGGFWTKSSSAEDYESRARKKLQTIFGQIKRSSGTPEATQRAHYEAAMTAQEVLLQSSAPQRAPSQDNAQLAATLDLFDRKLQSAGAGASQASQATKPSVSDPALHRIVQAIVKRYVDRAEFKAFLQPLSMEQRRAYLVKIATCGKHALAQYYQQQRASGSKSKGLGEVALVEHITGVVMKLMAKQGGGGAAGAASLGLHHQQQLRLREEENARVKAVREKMERERTEHERARRDGAGGIGGSNRVGGNEQTTGPMGGVMEMAAYWKRLGEMRGAYLPRAKQTMEVLKKKAKSGADDSTQKRNAEKFLQWFREHLVPMLSQTAENPCASAKFSMAELDHLDAQMKKLIAVAPIRAAAAQGSAAGGGGDSAKIAGGAPAMSSGAAESSFTSESAGVGTQKRDEKNERAVAEKEALKLEEEARLAAEASARRKAKRPSAFASVTYRDKTRGSATPPPTPFFLDLLPPPTTPGKPGDEIAGDDTAPPAIFVESSKSKAPAPVAMSFVNGGRELRRRALETEISSAALDAVDSAFIWKSWDDLVRRAA